jgi:hypothetical protein
MVRVNITLSEEKAKKEAMRILEQGANEIKNLSQVRCPVDTGTLRASARIEIKGNTIEFGYGGAASDYATIQHENLQFHHPVGQAKFLESAFDELVPKIIDNIKGVKI